jgi:hypothetical protein
MNIKIQTGKVKDDDSIYFSRIDLIDFLQELLMDAAEYRENQGEDEPQPKEQMLNWLIGVLTNFNEPRWPLEVIENKEDAVLQGELRVSVEGKDLKIATILHPKNGCFLNLDDTLHMMKTIRKQSLANAQTRLAKVCSEEECEEMAQYTDDIFNILYQVIQSGVETSFQDGKIEW